MSDSIKNVWVDPTVLADGSPLPAGDLAFISVEMSADQGATFTPVAHVAPGVQSFTQTNLVPGTYQFRLIAIDTQTPPLSSTPVILTQTIAAPPVVLAAPGPVTAASATVL